MLFIANMCQIVDCLVNIVNLAYNFRTSAMINSLAEKYTRNKKCGDVVFIFTRYSSMNFLY